MLLERDVVLPAAAEPSLGQVLRYEFDRLTPFSADDTYWTYRMTRRDKLSRQLHLRLILAPRRGLAWLLDSLSGAGIRLSALEGQTTASGLEWRQIRLGAAEQSGRGIRLHAALAAGLAVATIAVPFVRQSAALSTIDARLAAVQPLVTEATGLRTRLTIAAASKELLRVAQARVSDPLQAIAAVTDALPDDTWLTDLSLSQRHLTLSGQSEKAARLIARLATQGNLSNPTFTAPVTRASGERRDIFSVSAEWAP